MLLYLFLFAVALSQQYNLNQACLQGNGQVGAACVETVNEQVANADGGVDNVSKLRIKPELSALFSDKFSCFHDSAGMYNDWASQMYGNVRNQNNAYEFYCCGYMANGRRQCDRLDKWKRVGDSHFTLCEMDYATAVSETEGDGSPKPRRDLCCQNNHFNDCNLCKSFMVWDFTVEDDSRGGDPVLENEWTKTQNSQDGLVTLEDTWRVAFEGQAAPTVGPNDVGYPPYAYDNKIYPAGFARAKLREFNDPPVCVYAPNVAGRVIEVKVEPEESGSQVCVDDLHEDSLERNTPGVTQACDDSRLRTCFPDADPAADSNGFAFLISCSESCADGDLDLWFRLRASVNKWTENGDASLGATQTEVATEMWCMWGIQDMRDEDLASNLPEGFPSELDGDFSKWDLYPSDLEPLKDPEVRPVENGVLAFSICVVISMVALLF